MKHNVIVIFLKKLHFRDMWIWDNVISELLLSTFATLFIADSSSGEFSSEVLRNVNELLCELMYKVFFVLCEFIDFIKTFNNFLFSLWSVLISSKFTLLLAHCLITVYLQYIYSRKMSFVKINCLNSKKIVWFSQ